MYYKTKDYENNIDLCKCAMYKLAENIANTEIKELKNFLETTDKDFCDICDDLAVNLEECPIKNKDIYCFYKYKDISGIVTYSLKEKNWLIDINVNVIFADKFNLPPIGIKANW